MPLSCRVLKQICTWLIRLGLLAKKNTSADFRELLGLLRKSALYAFLVYGKEKNRGSVSRVLFPIYNIYKVSVIYLRPLLPIGSSNLPSDWSEQLS